MNNNSDIKLLAAGDYGESPYSLIIAQPINRNNIVNYFNEVCHKHAKFEIKRILELRPTDEGSSIQIPLRNAGYNVESMILSPELHAISQNKTGKSEFVLGKSFQFPENLGRYDAVLAPFGSFGLLTQQKEIDTVLEQVREILKPQGLFCAEIWHLGGVKKAASTTEGSRNWSQIEKENVFITRLTNSFLFLESSILQINIQYIIEKLSPSGIEKYKEIHNWRVYSLSEINTIFNKFNFKIEGLYRHLTMLPPELQSFRLSLVAINK
ncbi:MAG: hypothetical protein ACXAC7_05765 [Candidatus Hodarchaeales archaeon]